MSKFNVQLTVNNKIDYTQTFRDLDTSELTENEIADVFKNTFNLLIKKLEEKNQIKKVQTIIKPNSVKFFIENKEIKIKGFIDVLIETFKYLVDNKYINENKPSLKLKESNKNYIYNNYNWFTKKDHQWRALEYKGYYLYINLDRWHIHSYTIKLIDYFNVKSKIKIYNYPI